MERVIIVLLFFVRRAIIIFCLFSCEVNSTLKMKILAILSVFVILLVRKFNFVRKNLILACTCNCPKPDEMPENCPLNLEIYASLIKYF